MAPEPIHEQQQLQQQDDDLILVARNHPHHHPYGKLPSPYSLPTQLPSISPYRQHQSLPNDILPSPSLGSRRHKHKLRLLAAEKSALIPPSSIDPSERFQIKMIQNPQRARMSGFGVRDRRPLDPPPILQLQVNSNPSEKPYDTPSPLEDFQSVSFLICHCTLWSIDLRDEIKAAPVTVNTENYVPGDLPPVAQYSQVLLGSLISPCYSLTDENGHAGYYFVFPEVAIRTSGPYRLKFHLYDLTRCGFGIGNSRPLGFEGSPSLATCYSEPFNVFSPKTFPGMSDSTEISKAFARQGMKIHIRVDQRLKSADIPIEEEESGS